MAKAVHTRIPAAPTPPPTPATPAHVPAPVVTPVNPTRGVPTVLVVLFVLLFIAFGIWIISVLSPKSEEKAGNIEQTKTPSLPDRYDEYHILSKGKEVRVKIPPYYSLYCSGGGKKYYRQPQNGEKVLQGGNLPVPETDRTAYVDLSFYEEEITVVCTFIKN